MENILFIDFSMNSTALCLYNIKAKTYKYFSFVDRKHFTKSATVDVMKTTTLAKLGGCGIVFKVMNKKGGARPKGNPTSFNKSKFEDYINAGVLFEELLHEVMRDIDVSKTIVGIEDYAVSVKSNNVIEMSEFTMHMKSILFRHFDINKSLFFQPQEIKKITGNGNATKQDLMINLIKRNINHPLHKVIASNKDFFMTSNTVKKPIEDLIDSFFGVQLIRNLNNL